MNLQLSKSNKAQKECPEEEPTSYLDTSKTSKDSEKLRDSLERRIVGQRDAVDAVVNAYQAQLVGFNPVGRPLANFLFLGPTGTGKTRLVEVVAEHFLNNPKAMIKIDCAEFQHSHDIAKLVGSPPGYLGHRETHPMLSQGVLNQYHTEDVKLSFVLFDEIEKASDALWNLLLGILDKAVLSLGDNRKVDFSRTMIFMTSNLGSEKIEGVLAPKFGYDSAKMINTEEISEQLIRVSVGAVKKKFTPEFVNRLDNVVTFQPLDKNALTQILELELAAVQSRIISSSTVFVLQYTDACKEFLLRVGTDLKYGARHLKRAIESYIVRPVANLVGSGQIRKTDIILVGYSDALGVTFERSKEIVQ